ncbi:MAG: 3-oxoacyl-(acyl-carrier-protein) synthase III [Pseudohongiellaceae bacterium]|jgi:3-oxoacyl-(acyl-carrier-protein) synthase III
MLKSHIYSVGSELAKNAVLTRDILAEAKFDDVDLVEKSLGIKEVRQAPLNTQPSELAVPAAERALNESGLQYHEIDAVIYCGIERDCPEPATAHIIASKLGLTPTICFDVANACHGFTSGLQVANSFIRSGDVRHVLVVTAELSSKITRQVTEMFKTGALQQEDIKTHIGAMTVGDAAGAMVLGPTEDGSGIDQIRCGSVSRHHALCSYNNNEYGNLSFNMDMGRISAVTLKLVKELIGPTYEGLNWKPEDVDLFIPHQVGERPFMKSLEIVGIDKDKSIATYPNLGNLASATVPVCYDMMKKQGRLVPGSKMLMGTTGSGIVASFVGISL